MNFSKKTFIVLIFVFAAVLLINLSSAELWWDTSWHFRVPINISSSSPVMNARVIMNVNFSQFFSSLNVSGNFDPDSVRVIENGIELPHDWENDSYDTGNITWIANGTTQDNRTFWIYFDVSENGAKPSGEIISEYVHWRSGYTNNMDVYSSTWSRPWAQSIEVSWKWSSEQFYDFAYLYIDGVETEKKDGVNSENTTFLGSSIKGRFTSDTSGIYSATDDYGTYGCAIDMIKFYSVENYTDVSLDTYLGNPEMQNLINNLEIPLQDSRYEQGDLITLRANILDDGSDPLDGVNVSFTIENDTTSYLCFATENSGEYVCVWNSSDMTIGNYSIMLNSSKDFYYSNSTFYENRFQLEYGPPSISMNMTDKIEQNSSIQINATAQDRSGTGIAWVRVNVTKPDNTTDQFNMTNVSDLWTMIYNDAGERGIYLVKVFSQDNNGKIGQSNRTFGAYVKLNATLMTQSSYYYQGSYGRVEYTIVDTVDNPVENVNVTLTIRNPSGSMIWNDNNQTEVTDSDGMIEPMPLFQIVSSDPVGNYTLESFSQYYDTLADCVVNRTDSYVFQVLGQALNFMTLDLDSPLEVSLGDPLKVSAAVTDGSQSIDPDSIRASLYDPLDNLIIDNVSMTYLETGLYSSQYITSSSSTQGNWRWVVKAVRGSNGITKQVYSHFVGGPFDVRNITIIDNVVPDLAISVIVENKGDAGQDVMIEWNLTRTDNGSILDNKAETILVPGNSLKVYTAYPSTDYVGQVKITFVAHYSGTEKAGAYSTFNTVSEGGHAGGGGGNVGEITPEKEFEIVNLTKEIDVELGGVSVMNLVVRNSGNVALKNISINMSGVENNWISIPDNFDLDANETKSINIGFNIPANAKVGVYNGTIVVGNNEIQDNSSFVLKIFASREELYLYKIQVLKDRVKNVEKEIIQAQNEGKEVSDARTLLDNAREKVTEAEISLNNQDFESTSDAITMANDYLDRAEFEVQIAKVAPKSFTQKWIFYAIVILGAMLIAFVIWIILRLKKMELKLSGVSLKRVFMGRASYKQLEKEKDKLEKILALLDKEYKQKMISKESYDEIKGKNMEKLNQVNDILKTEK